MNNQKEQKFQIQEEFKLKGTYLLIDAMKIIITISVVLISVLAYISTVKDFQGFDFFLFNISLITLTLSVVYSALCILSIVNKLYKFTGLESDLLIKDNEVDMLVFGTLFTLGIGLFTFLIFI